MPRRIRLDGPAVAHHVMLRGVGGADLFLHTDDLQNFVDRLSRLLPECGARCFAWALMSNHVHLVVQTETGALSRVMKRLGTGYAVRFNRRYQRRGYVFMDRFRSRIVADDADLIGLIRYVHANPIQAGIVASLEALAAHPWSGHGALVGARPALPFEAVEAALSLFDDHAGRAREELLSWMARDEASTAAAPPTAEAPTIPAAPIRMARGDGLESLLQEACARYGLALHELASGVKTPRVARARAAVAYLAVVALGLPRGMVAAALGVGGSAISGALDRGRRIAIEDGFWAEDEPSHGANLTI